MRTQTGKLTIFASLFYLALTGYLVVRCLILNNGQLVYALDDPYIHLAVAENLVKGHYGLNLREASSPSSSVLWPYLLTPFAGTAMHVYVPLALNVFSGIASACLIGYFIARWPPQKEQHQTMSLGKAMLVTALLVFCANLAGLTMLGMEHVLQVALAIVCAVGVAKALDNQPIPLWCLAAAAIAPCLRYEDLGLTLAVCIALLGQRRWKQSISVLALSLVPLVGFFRFSGKQRTTRAA